MGDDRAGHEARLAAVRAGTEQRLGALTRDFDRIVAAVALSPPDDEHDPEGATTAFERQQLAALIAAAQSHLTDLARAADRVRSGTYGICAVCGQAIPPARLEARPTATTCISCARLGPSRAAPTRS